jgi:hypothetical protein
MLLPSERPLRTAAPVAVSGIRIAVGLQPLDACESIDLNGDGMATVADLIVAVRLAATTCH